MIDGEVIAAVAGDTCPTCQEQVLVLAVSIKQEGTTGLRVEERTVCGCLNMLREHVTLRTL